jgi:hypothetical protein
MAQELSASSPSVVRLHPPPLKFLLSTAAIWAGFSLFGATETYVSVLSHGHSFLRILLCQALLWMLWALIAPGIFLFSFRLPVVPWSLSRLFIHIGVAAVLSVLHVAALVVLTLWIRPFDAVSPTEFRPAFLKSLPYNLELEMLIYMLIVGAAHTWAYYARYRERERDAGRLAAELAHARLHALELQLRPHFLFNTLHTIGGLVRMQSNQEAVAMIVRLSSLLRECLTTDGAQQVPLAQELALFDHYLDIERVRYSDRLTVEVDAPTEVRHALVPRFILQPLAENAIRHGIDQVAGAARLALAVRRDGEVLRIELWNSGPGIGIDVGRGIGLRNTETRLRQLYGTAGTIALRDESGGVMAAVAIPYMTDAAAETVR